MSLAAARQPLAKGPCRQRSVDRQAATGLAAGASHSLRTEPGGSVADRSTGVDNPRYGRESQHVGCLRGRCLQARSGASHLDGGWRISVQARLPVAGNGIRLGIEAHLTKHRRLGAETAAANPSTSQWSSLALERPVTPSDGWRLRGRSSSSCSTDGSSWIEAGPERASTLCADIHWKVCTGRRARLKRHFVAR